jgi:hypothetical protein
MTQWSAIAKYFTGWSLDEIKELSPRERLNWLEIIRESKGIVRK